MHKYCLQNMTIFCSGIWNAPTTHVPSVNKLMFAIFFFFLHLYQGLIVLTLIKKSFFFFKFAISYSNLTLLLIFFMKKKKKTYSHVKYYLQNRITLLVHLRSFSNSNCFFFSSPILSNSFYLPLCFRFHYKQQQQQIDLR